MPKPTFAVTVHLSDFDTMQITADELMALRAFDLVDYDAEKNRFKARLLDGAVQFIEALRAAVPAE